MPIINTTRLKPRHLAGIAAALAIAIGGGAMLVVDSGEYQSAVEALKDDAGVRDEVADLLSDPVPPGGTMRTEVTMPGGHRVIGAPVLTLGSDISFGPVTVTYRDQEATQVSPTRTFVTFTAINTSTATRRFTALVYYGAP